MALGIDAKKKIRLSYTHRSGHGCHIPVLDPDQKGGFVLHPKLGLAPRPLCVGLNDSMHHIEDYNHWGQEPVGRHRTQTGWGGEQTLP